MFEEQFLPEVSPGDIRLSNQMGIEFPRFLLHVLIGFGLLLLVMAFINYISLTMAKSLSSAREVGIRKTAGAGKMQIRLQFLTEAILTSLLSLGLGIVMLEYLLRGLSLLHPFINQIFFLEHTVSVYLLFLVFAIAAGLLAGLIPALRIARFRPTDVLKAWTVKRSKSGMAMSKILLTIQFAFTILFLISTLTLLRQKGHLLSVDMGFETENILNVELQGQPYERFAAAMSGIAGVKGQSASAIIPGKSFEMGIELRISGEAFKSFSYNIVDPGYLSTLDLKIAAGSPFAPVSTSSEEQVWLNMEAVKVLGFTLPDEAVGVRLWPKAETDSVVPMRVAGVVHNFHFRSLADPGSRIGPFVLIQRKVGLRIAQVKVEAGQTIGVLNQMEQRWKALGAEEPLMYTFFDDEIRSEYQVFNMASGIIGFLGTLILIITCLGLLGMVTFAVESRKKEVGIRKILGASQRQLLWQLSREFFLLQFLALLIAIPAAWLLNQRWLSLYEVKTAMDWQIFLPGIGLPLVLSLTAMVPQILRSTNASPVMVVRDGV